MWGCYTATLFYAAPPPLSLRQKVAAPQGHEKHPGFGLSQPISSGSANRVARHVENWVKVLEEDPREIHRAAAEAQRMSDYLIEFAGLELSALEQQHDKAAYRAVPLAT